MFHAEERRSVVAIAAVYGLRMFGLFLILPVFALYAEKLAGASPGLVGVALGAYGLTMALLQIPFGVLSDRLGRKPVIIAGLGIFAAGSVVAALSDTIQGVILGRALQGAGAISAALTALLADLTREEVRLKAMATIGMTIGMSFAASLVLAPWLDAAIGVRGIFWLTAVLAVGAIGVIAWIVPTPKRIVHRREAEAGWRDLASVVRNPDLLRLDFGIFALHGAMTAIFTALPFVLRDRLGIASQHHSWLYLGTLLAALMLMVPFVIAAEKRGKLKAVFLLAIAGVAAASLVLAEASALWSVAFGLWLFFMFYNVLEATLPSWISRQAPLAARGAAMGVYSTSQFFGAFAGGLLGGLAHAHWGEEGVFFVAAAWMGLWLLIAWGQRPPRMWQTKMLSVHAEHTSDARQLEQALLALSGVHEVFVDLEEGLALLRVDPERFDEQAAKRLLQGEERVGS